MPPVGFEPTISAGERPQTYVLDRAVPGTAPTIVTLNIFLLTSYEITNETSVGLTSEATNRNKILVQ